jgi:xylan 1,4-beta-xylosidase
MILNNYTNHQGLPFEQEVKEYFTNELQWHSDFIISFILKGTVNIHTKNRGHLLKENDIFFLEPFNSYSILATSDQVRVLTFSVDYEFLNHLSPDIETIILSTNYLRADYASDIHQLLSKNIAQIVLHTLKNGACQRLKCLSAISNILTTIIESFGSKQNEATTPPSYVQLRVKEITQYINDNYSEKITLDDISEQLGIHPQYFSSFFKKNFNKNFVEYLTDFRVSRSLPKLLNSNESILDIAISCGFSNHKTYSAAFKKLYGSSPNQYKKEHQPEALLPVVLQKDSQDGYFYYFQKFWNEETWAQTKSAMQTHMSIQLDLLSTNPESFKNKQPILIDAGRAASCLRNEIQDQIKSAKKDFDFNYLRLRDIFSDDLFVYYEEADKVPVFNWQYIDIIFDFLLSIHVRPFIELGFMPRHLASKKQFAGWHFHPNVSYPKSEEKWSMLVAGFMKHCIERYSLTEVQTWYFDFWACPDLQLKDGYWNETRDKFFEFYYLTYRAIKGVNHELRIGSPNFSTPTGYDWYDAFFQYCNTNQIEPAFVSVHLYGCDTSIGDRNFISYADEFLKPPTLPDKSQITQGINGLQDIMNQNGFGHYKIIVSNWNITFYPGDLTRDTSFMGPYIAYVYASTLKLVYGLCYRSLSDINEDFFPNSTLFHGGPGLMDFYGLKKASYNTFYLLCKLGKTIIERNDNYIVAQSDRGYQILVFNLSFYDTLYRLSDRSALSYTQRYNVYEVTEELVTHIILTVDPGIYSVKRSVVNRNAGSAYDLWLNMGSPGKLTPPLVEYIRNKSIPEITFRTEEVTLNSNLVIEETLPPHGVVLFEIEKNIQ